MNRLSKLAIFFMFMVMNKSNGMGKMAVHNYHEGCHQSIKYIDEDDAGSKETENLYLYIQRVKQPSLATIKTYFNNGAHANGYFQGISLLEAVIGKVTPAMNEQDRQEYINIVECFLEKGADPNIKNKGSDVFVSPLQRVNYIYNDNQALHKKVISLLYKYGANPALKNAKGETAFFDHASIVFIPNASKIGDIKIRNTKEKMRNYLLHGCYRKRDESIAFVKKMEKVVVTPSISAFVHKTCRQLPKDIKKQIVFLTDNAIDYQKTVQRGLLRTEEDQLPKLIEACPQWTRQSIKSVRILVPYRANSITELLKAHYLKEGKKVLEIKNKSGMMAKDSSLCLSTLLDPERFKENFSDVIKEVINQESV